MKTLLILTLLTLPLSVRAEALAEDNSFLPWDEMTVEAVAPGTVEPEAAKVKLLGSFKVGPALGAFRVAVPGCGNNITAVKFRVTGATVLVQDFGVQYASGEAKSYSVNQSFAGGSETPWIDLSLLRSKDPRCVTRVTARARTQNGPASKVELFIALP